MSDNTNVSNAAVASHVDETRGGEEDQHGNSADRYEARFLIENSLVGGVIGTGGANVKRVRETTDTYVTIVRNQQPTIDRIMILRGKVENVAKAISVLAELVIDAQLHNATKAHQSAAAPGLSTKPPPKRAEKVAFRMLVHQSTVGAIIGKAAVLLKETQESTGVRISISQTALPNSTEKSVTVTGTPEALEAAFLRMLQQLKDSSPSRNRFVPFDPAQTANQFYNPPFYPPAAQPYQPNGPGVPATASQKIAVPSVCAGCIIGRGGAVIRDLRVRSGAQISIQDADPKAPLERVVTLTGTPNSINTAVYMIRQLVEQYQPHKPQAQ